MSVTPGSRLFLQAAEQLQSLLQLPGLGQGLGNWQLLVTGRAETYNLFPDFYFDSIFFSPVIHLHLDGGGTVGYDLIDLVLFGLLSAVSRNTL